MREAKVENYLKTKIEELDGKCLKFVSPGKSGVPDRLCLMDGGKHFFVEVKRPGAKLRALQLKCKREFEAIGHDVYVVDSIESVDELITRIRRG